MLSIRTQDRMALVPYGTIGYPELRPQCDDDNLWRIDMNCIDRLSRTLGAYATKERALEVLDEIEKNVNGKIYINQNPEPNENHWSYVYHG